MATVNCTCGCKSSIYGTTGSGVITIFQGDDTDAMGRSITVTVISTNDWTGYRARFQLGSVYKDYSDVSSKTFNISLSKTDTRKLPLGRIDGYIKFIDGNGKMTTEETVIPFDVQQMVVRNTGL